MTYSVFDIFGPRDGALAASAVAAAFPLWLLFSMTWRMIRPIPQTDEEAIQRAFELRGQTVRSIRKRWVGGPWRYLGPQAPIPYQSGRPYLVEASGALHAVAVQGIDQREDPIVLLQGRDGWNQISRLRPAITPLVLTDDER